jgi:virginiamycin A acetyltransferase
MLVARSPARGAAAVLKGLVDLLAMLVAMPFFIAYRLSAMIAPARADTFFQSCSEALSIWPGITGGYVRRAFYRLTLRRCARDCSIGFGTVFATPTAEIGPGVYIGTYGNIGHATIGADTLLGSNVTILSGRQQHHFDRLDIPIRHQGGTYNRVMVGRDAWIGNGAIISCDVGDQAIVAAGAIVVRPVSPRAIVGGNPAVVIGERGQSRDEPAAQYQVTISS